MDGYLDIRASRLQLRSEPQLGKALALLLVDLDNLQGTIASSILVGNGASIFMNEYIFFGYFDPDYIFLENET